MKMDVKLTLVTLMLFHFMRLVLDIFRRLRLLTRERSKALAGVQSYLHERVQGMSIIKSFTLEKHEQKLFDETNGKFLDKAIEQTRWNAKTFAVVNTITDIAPLLVIGYAGYQGNTWKSLSWYDGCIHCIYRSLYSPLRRLVNSSTTLTQSVASMDRMFELIDEKYDIVNAEGAKA